MREQESHGIEKHKALIDYDYSFKCIYFFIYL